MQFAIPEGGEDVARSFYGGILGFVEVPKPPELAGRGGAWFETGDVHVHLGVDPDFKAARKAHVAFVVDDVRSLVDACRSRQLEVVDDDPVEGVERAFLFDPFGNRIEIVRPLS